MGASTNRATSFFFRLFLGEKQFTRSSRLYFRVLHGANIAVRVAFDHDRAFKGENKQIRRGENIADSQHVE